MVSLFPSLIGANVLNLGQEIDLLEPHCDGFHIDIMDNHFVPNLTWGAAVTNALAAYSKKPLWVHLMVDNPADWPRLLTLSADSILTFHSEATSNHEALIRTIREKKWRVGIAVSPKTPVATLFGIAPLVDQILIMSVEPGFSGQKFIPNSYEKVRELCTYRAAHNLSFKIGIDGGVTKDIIADLRDLGVDEFAISSAIFAQQDRVEATQTLRRLAT